MVLGAGHNGAAGALLAAADQNAVDVDHKGDVEELADEGNPLGHRGAVADAKHHRPAPCPVRVLVCVCGGGGCCGVVGVVSAFVVYRAW